MKHASSEKCRNKYYRAILYQAKMRMQMALATMHYALFDELTAEYESVLVAHDWINNEP